MALDKRERVPEIGEEAIIGRRGRKMMEVLVWTVWIGFLAD